ncbi:MAG TPA: glycoside hydrolase family 3 C-terminal domain-containing protein [Bacteroidales bacterium]|nr:glycoside hydrolase family 3 C-terminal domain-containing protein [Bacteroidales bacterium]HRX97386.1 glycoside hydrolase family 3 C-terminal domain-containing protein [Bacteroidales bacterium]
MKKYLPIILVVFLFSCQEEKKQVITYDFPFQNPELSIDERVDDLVSRLTIKEKASLMLYNSPAIERLGIPEYNWWNECLHGVGRAGKATVFPQAIGMAATFDEDLIFRVSTAISDEARAKHHAAVRMGNREQYVGLSFWTPNINIFRDPRWGRGQETYGEDPYLTSRMGIAFVKGLQGDDPQYLKTSACAKHYVVHSGPEKGRHYFNALPPERDFRETYLPGFEALVEQGHVEAVMCAYNRTYDKPCCGSGYLLNDILRKEWGFKGHIVSDCWALDDMWLRHKVVETRMEAAAMAAEAGVNLNCGYLYQYLPHAVDSGLITEQTLDSALIPLMRSRFKLGLFDPEGYGPYAGITPDVINNEAHQKLAYETAAKSIVLLKNKNHVLPLDNKTTKTILVAGPTAMDVNCLVGNYSGYSGNLTTILEGMVDRAAPGAVVEYTQGVLFNNDSLFAGFWQAGRADAVVVCLGINSLFEGEEGDAMMNSHGGDRVDIGLPPNQVEYVKRIRDKMKDKPLIVVITGGSAMAIPEIDSIADAILFAWYPGESGGFAVADVIFGNSNPSGRLPVTFYKSVKDLPDFENYSMDGRTYRYFEGEPLYPFGYGLSFTEFEYANPKIGQNGGKVELQIEVKNTGDYAGDEVVQVYARKVDPKFWRPAKQLVAFKRVTLKSGQSNNFTIPIDTKQLQYWDVETQSYKIEPGTYQLMIGGSSENIQTTTSIEL